MNAKNLITITAMLILCSFSNKIEAKYFGTLCQENFLEDDGSVSTIAHSYTHCSRFNSKMDSIGNTDKRFYQTIDTWNEDGWSSSDDYRSSVGGLDSASLVFISSHGNSYKTHSTISKYDGGHTSNNWEFGNSGKKLHVLAMYACSTMRINSTRYTELDNGTKFDHGGKNYQWDRFKRVLKAGTKIILGAYDSMYGGYWHKNEGKNFANYLKSGHSFQYAWRRAYKSHHPNTLAAGKSSSNCSNRKNKMKWSNSYSYDHLSSSNITHYCQQWGF